MKNSSLNQNNHSVAKDANYYFQEGNAFYFLGNTEKAIDAYTEVIKLNPNCTNAYFNRGIAQSAKANQVCTYYKYDDFKKVIELDPNDSEAYFQYGNKSLSALGRRPEAYLATLEAYNNAIRLNPNFADAYYNRYKILLTLNKPAEAIIDGKKAVELKTSIDNNGTPITELSKLKNPDQLIYNYNIRLKIGDINVNPSPLEKNQKTLDFYNQNIKDNYYNKGKLLNSIGCEDEAFACFLKGLEITQSDNNNEIVQNREILLKQLISLNKITKEVENTLARSDQTAPEVKKLVYFFKELTKTRASINEQVFESLEKQTKLENFNKLDLSTLSKKINDTLWQAEEISKQTKKLNLSQTTFDNTNNNTKSIIEIKEMIEQNKDIKQGDKAIIQSLVDNILNKLPSLKDKTEAQKTIEAIRGYINDRNVMAERCNKVKKWLFEADEYLDQKIESQETLNETMLSGLTEQTANEIY